MEEKSRSELSLSSDQKQRLLESPRAVARLPFCRERQILLLRMLVSDLCMLVGVLAVLVSRRSMDFRLIMLTLVVMMGRLKVVMGCGAMVSGSSVVMLARSVFLLGHLVNSPNESVVSARGDAPVVNPLRPR